jgi:hypothetical protein
VSYRPRRSGEHLGGGIPSGTGSPADVTAEGDPGTGGGAFGTFWPLATGTQAEITQGQGGGTSHTSPYTRYAIDLGIQTGTEVRAGFTGVVARISNTCSAGVAGCGDGFGNYVLLKGSDGTCSLHAHFSRVDVWPGLQVPKYTLLGLSGATGHVDGPHLHYDHVDCDNFHSLPWAPAEGGSLATGTVITSQNAPDCTALQGGCSNPQGNNANPQGNNSNPQQPGDPGGGGSSGTGGNQPQPAASISAAKGGPYKGGYTLDIAVHNFPTGTYTYSCHDNSGPGGADTVFWSHSVTVSDPNQSAWPGVFCYDSAPYVAYLEMNGVLSNRVQY